MLTGVMLVAGGKWKISDSKSSDIHCITPAIIDIRPTVEVKQHLLSHERLVEFRTGQQGIDLRSSPGILYQFLQ